MYLCFSIFEPVCDQLQTALALLSYNRKKDVCSETSVMASKPTSVNDLPDEIVLEILSYVGPEDLCLNVANVCKRWSVSAKDIILWKTISYHCDFSSDLSCIAEVRCTIFLGFSSD
jgi:hypothetical protein